MYKFIDANFKFKVRIPYEPGSHDARRWLSDHSCTEHIDFEFDVHNDIIFYFLSKETALEFALVFL